MKALLASLGLVLCAPTFAEVPPPAYQRAALYGGIPAEVLYAVAKIESSHRLKIGFYPWPWTLNVKGKGYYFATRNEACTAAMSAIAQHGKYGVDIGLTQQNWGWVGVSFYQQPCDALAPDENLRTAAVQLRKCYEKEKDWVYAAGCYHRPAGGEPARKYRAKFYEKYSQLK